MSRQQRRPLTLILALAGILAMLGAGAVTAQAARKAPPAKVKTSVRYDQVFSQRVPGLGGNTCIKTQVRGTIAYEYTWRLGPRPQPGKPQKRIPSLDKMTIQSPQVVVSAWSACSGSKRKSVKLSAAEWEQRWLNSNECSASGLSLSVGGPPWAAYVGTTINCGESSFIGRKSEFFKSDNDFQESNSGVKIGIQNTALKWTQKANTSNRACARVEVGGRVVKSNRNDKFGHVFHPCIQLPAQRNL